MILLVLLAPLAGAAEGGWTEGLDAYLSQHRAAEARGEGADFRCKALSETAPDRLMAAGDQLHPGRALMIVHMARMKAGDQAFSAALAAAGEHPSLQALQEALEEQTGESWGRFFKDWTGKEGLPELVLTRQEVFGVLHEEGGQVSETWKLALELRQVQPGKPQRLDLPLAITLEGQEVARWETLSMKGRRAKLVLELPERPLRLDVDPLCDLLRWRSPLERTPTMGELSSSQPLFFVLPAGAPEAEQRAWEDLAAAWTPDGQAHIVLDAELPALPPGATWVLGWTNALGPAVAERLAGQGVILQGLRLQVDGRTLDQHDASAIVARDPANPRIYTGWIGAPLDRIPALARALPSYADSSYVGFDGERFRLVHQGRWQPIASPLTRILKPGTELVVEERGQVK